jgi:hypothetical protein
MVVASGLVSITLNAFACPFCGVVGRSLAERRDTASAVAVGEPTGLLAVTPDGRSSQPCTIRQLIRGEAAPGEIVLARVDGPLSGLALLFREGDAPPARWSAIAADETLLGHVAAAPGIKEPAGERLTWFAPRLEHPNAAIAADAFTEFGLAPFSAVRATATAFDDNLLRAWVLEPGIAEQRRGLYGLLLGIIAERSVESAERSASIAALHDAIEAPASDFRTGIDGIMGGILVAEGEQGLDYLEGRGLLGKTARPVEQRHLLAALRFAWENLPTRIPRPRIASATARLALSPAVAADAVIDLARYEAWEATEAVAGLWDTAGKDDPLVRRAIAGYLTTCPMPEAKAHLERLRAGDPGRLQAAIDAASLPAR